MGQTRRSDEHYQEFISASEEGPWQSEILSRYYFAATLLGDGIILDVGCGDGSGSEVLASGGRWICGLDKVGRFNPARQSIQLCLGDALALPFPAQSLDAIVSFETIEHLQEPDLFLAECQRVLKSGGVLILSTPNRDVDELRNDPPNPYHLNMFSPGDLERTLSKWFVSVELFGHTTTAAFGPSPFWTPDPLLPKGLRSRLSLASWKLIRRLPSAGFISEIVLGKSLYPRVEDFRFDPTLVGQAHVLVGVCKSES